MSIRIKAQTPRTTKMLRIEPININLFFSGLELGVITSEYWGDFRQRKEPLITIETKNFTCVLPVSEFIKRIKREVKA